MSVSQYISAVRAGMGSMVHPAARNDPATAARQEAFIASRLAGGVAAFAAFPVYLASVGKPEVVEVAAFAWLMAPLALALYLSRSGRYDAALAASAASFAGLVAFAVVVGGAPLSPLLVWLLLVPAEPVLAGGSRRCVVSACVAAAAAPLAALAGSAWLGLAPAHGAAWLLPLLGALPALLNLAARSWAGRAGAETRPDLADEAGDILARHRRNGNVIHASAAASRVLDAAPADLLGEGLFKRIHVADRPAYLKALDDAATAGAATAAFRVRGSDEAGFVWIEMTARAAASADDELVTVLRDIGARKTEEGELSAAREEAERASLAKSRFLASVSHELRTPLNAIIGFSEILCNETFGRLEQERHREYAVLIRDSGQHLLDVINDILDMSRIETGNFQIHPEPFDLAGLVDNACRMMQTQVAEAGLRLETDLPTGLGETVADAKACRQMLLNLLHNAVKFSERGGRIVAGAHLRGDDVVIYVADEGIGIAPADIARLGEPFTQVHASYDRRYEGTGLGLSVVKGLAALHGGRLEIDSELGAGTRARVCLPARPAARPAPVARLEPARGTATAAGGADEPLRMRA